MTTRTAWRPLKRVLRVVAFLVLAVLLLAIGAYLLRGPLFGRLLADRIERELGTALGGRFSIARVEGSYLFDLAVVGLRTEEAPPGALRRLDCDRIVVEYDLKRLIGGDLSGVSLVLVSGAVVEADATRSGGASGDTELPKHLPRLEIYGRVAVATAMGEVRAEGLSVVTAGRNRIGIRANALRLPDRFGPAAPFAGMLERTGPLAFVLSSDTPLAGITPVRVSYEGGALDARLLVGVSSAEVRVAGGEARFLGAALDLARLPAWVYPEGVDRPHEAVASVDARVVSFEPLLVEVVAGAERIRWRDVDLRDARVEARYEDGKVLVRSAHAEGEGVVLDARDVLVDPALPWVVADVGEATVRVPDIRAFEPGFDRPLSLVVTVRRAGTKGFAVEQARLEGEGILLEGKGEVVPPDDPARWQETQVTADYTGSVRDFTSGAYGFLGEVRLSGKVTGTIAAPDATAEVEGTGLSVEGRRVDRVRLAARIAPPLLQVRELRVEGEAGTLRAQAAVDLGTRTLSEASYEIDVTDLGSFLRLFPGVPVVEGSLSGNGSLATDVKGLVGTAKITALGLVSAGKEIGDLALKVRASGGEITIEEAEARGPWGTAKAKGVVRPDDARASVDALEVDAGPVHARLNRPFRVGWTETGAHAGPLDFAALGGRLQGTFSVEGERPEAVLRGEGIDLSLLDARFGGRATVDLRIEGDRYEIDATAPGATYEGRAASVRLKASSGLDGIIVEKLLLDAGEMLTVEGSATLPWRFDGEAFERVETVKPSLVLKARAQRVALGGIGVGEAVASVRGEGRDFKASVRLRDASVDGFAVRGETLVEVAATSGRLEATAVLERCDLGDAEARLAADRGFDWTKPEEIRAALEAARLDGEIKLRAPDLATLRRLVPGLAELSGAADGAIVLRGPLLAPAIEGRLHFAGVEAKPEGNLPRFTGGRGDILFDGTTVRIEEFAGEIGYAPVGVSGTIGFGTGRPVLDLKLTGRNALLVADRGLRVRADLDLVLTGTPDAPKVGGKVVLTDALYTRASSGGGGGPSASAASDAGPLFSIRSAPLASATFDLEITADETIRARTPSIAGNISCDLRLRGTGEAPAPEGRIFFRDLLVEMRPVAPIRVDRGGILFPPGEPFDPRIDVMAHTRIKGYSLEVGVDGRLADAQLRVVSRPALSQDDAILLLATGYTPDELEGEGISQAAFGKLASFLGERLVSRFSGPSDPDERSFLDRFKFTVGKDVSRSGESTIEAEFEASDKVFLRIERDRFDEYNGGVVWRFRFR